MVVAVATPRLGVVNDGEMSGAFSARSDVRLVTSACAMLADGVCNTPETTFTNPVPDGAGPVAPVAPVAAWSSETVIVCPSSSVKISVIVSAINLKSCVA